MSSTKTCSKCGEVKSRAEFSKHKHKTDGLKPVCKSCDREYQKKHYEANAEAIRERVKKYRKANTEAIREQRKKYREANAEAIRERQKKHYEANAEAILERQKKHYEANAEAILERQKKYRKASAEAIREYQKKYRKANAEELREYQKKYREANPEAIRERKKKYQRKKLATDPLFRFTWYLKSLIRGSLKRAGAKKNTRTEQLLGCTIAEFRDHLERQFVDGMSWENRSLWDIDHIIPMASAVTQEDAERLQHYTNLRPMWSSPNRSQGARGYKGTRAKAKKEMKHD